MSPSEGVKREGLSGPLPSSSMRPGQDHSDIDRAIESLDWEGRATQEKARKLIELGQAHEVMKQNIVRSAAIVTGQVQTTETGEVVLPNNTSDDRSKAIAIQSVAGTVAVLVNLLWITYMGTNLPPELYAAIPVLIQVIAHGAATAINNRKPKGA